MTLFWCLFVNFELISHIDQVFLLLTWSRYMPSWYIYIYIYMYICIQTYIYNIYIYICMCVCIYVCRVYDSIHIKVFSFLDKRPGFLKTIEFFVWYFPLFNLIVQCTIKLYKNQSKKANFMSTMWGTLLKVYISFASVYSLKLGHKNSFIFFATDFCNPTQEQWNHWSHLEHWTHTEKFWLFCQWDISDISRKISFIEIWNLL